MSGTAANPPRRPAAAVLREATRYLLASLLLALAACAAPVHPEPVSSSVLAADGEVAIPADLIVTSPRICAALAVYDLADHDDWGLRAAIALTALNGFRAADRVPNCAAGVGAALTQEFSPRRWQDALDAVDAVTSGSYSVSPDACTRATAVASLSSVVNAETPSAARVHCVIYDLAFVSAAP